MADGIGGTTGASGNAGGATGAPAGSTPTTNAAPVTGTVTAAAPAATAPARDYSQPKGTTGQPAPAAAVVAPQDDPENQTGAEGGTDAAQDGDAADGTDAAADPNAAPQPADFSAHPFGVDPALVQSAISMLMGSVATLNDQTNTPGASTPAPGDAASGPQNASQKQTPAADASGAGFLTDAQIAQLKTETVDEALIDGALVPMNNALKAAAQRNQVLEQRLAQLESRHAASDMAEARALDEQVDSYLAGEVSKLGLSNVYGTAQAKQTPQQQQALRKVAGLAMRIAAEKAQAGQAIQPLEALKLAMAVSHLDKFQAAATKAAVQKVTPALDAQQRVMSPRRVGAGGAPASASLDESWVNRYSAPKPRT